MPTEEYLAPEPLRCTETLLRDALVASGDTFPDGHCDQGSSGENNASSVSLNELTLRGDFSPLFARPQPALESARVLTALAARGALRSLQRLILVANGEIFR